MSDRQLVKMIIAEAVTYAISGVIGDCIIGLPMHWFVYVSLITNFGGTAWSIPFIPLGLIIVVIIFISCSTATSKAVTQNVYCRKY